MRGPGWNFFGPFEMWDSHKVVAMNNINLSEIIWVKMFNMGLPKNILIRESIGIFIVAFYLLALPYFFLQGSKPTEKCLKKIVGVLPMPSKWKTSFNQSFSLGFFTEVYEKVGFVRFHLFLQLFLIMFSVPIKMYLRWGFNLKYIVAIPEYMFNI